VEFEGAVYPTVEHAFAAAKTLRFTVRELIRLAPRPGEAKGLGRQVALRAGRDDMRVEVMRGAACWRASLRLGLTSRLGCWRPRTPSSWRAMRGGDRFWGACRGQGRNELGQLLMEWRDELRSSPSTGSSGWQPFLE
jgi:predicted NAD-dependent protein-ADP-ribosyltransferase YbiA (DUF1768 family)